MRGGIVFNIIGKMGAEVERFSETVGNGLCAVPPLKGRNRFRNYQARPPFLSFRPQRQRSGGIFYVR